MTGYSRVIDDFTRGAPELRFRISKVGAVKPILHGFGADGSDAGLHLCVEGELVGFLLLEVPRPIVMRRADQTHLFTVTLRSFLGATGRLVAPSGATLAKLTRSKRDWVARDAGGAELTRFTQAAEGVLTGPHGELIVRREPVEGELLSLKFATPSPLVRAAMFGVAALYDYVVA